MARRIFRLSPAASRGRGRVPPHNLDAEASLLGAMLLSASPSPPPSRSSPAEDFYKPAHGHIFEAITSLYGSGEPIDPVTVAEELRRADLLDAIGGPAVLVDLQATTPAISNAGAYAHIVEEHALLRRLIGVAGEIAELGYSVPDDVTKAVDRAEAMVYDVAQRRVADTMSPVHDLLETASTGSNSSMTGASRSPVSLRATTISTSCCRDCNRRRSSSSGPARRGQVRRGGHADPRPGDGRAANRRRGPPDRHRRTSRCRCVARWRWFAHGRRA